MKNPSKVEQIKSSKPILPCPFCGEEPVMVDCGDMFGYFLRCNCGIEQSKIYKNKYDAINHWNRGRNG